MAYNDDYYIHYIPNAAADLVASSSSYGDILGRSKDEILRNYVIMLKERARNLMVEINGSIEGNGREISETSKDGLIDMFVNLLTDKPESGGFYSEDFISVADLRAGDNGIPIPSDITSTLSKAEIDYQVNARTQKLAKLESAFEEAVYHNKHGYSSNMEKIVDFFQQLEKSAPDLLNAFREQAERDVINYFYKETGEVKQKGRYPTRETALKNLNSSTYTEGLSNLSKKMREDIVLSILDKTKRRAFKFNHINSYRGAQFTSLYRCYLLYAAILPPHSVDKNSRLATHQKAINKMLAGHFNTINGLLKEMTDTLGGIVMVNGFRRVANMITDMGPKKTEVGVTLSPHAAGQESIGKIAAVSNDFYQKATGIERKDKGPLSRAVYSKADRFTSFHLNAEADGAHLDFTFNIPESIKARSYEKGITRNDEGIVDTVSFNKFQATTSMWNVLLYELKLNDENMINLYRLLSIRKNPQTSVSSVARALAEKKYPGGWDSSLQDQASEMWEELKERAHVAFFANAVSGLSLEAGGEAYILNINGTYLSVGALFTMLADRIADDFDAFNFSIGDEGIGDPFRGRTLNQKHFYTRFNSWQGSLKHASREDAQARTERFYQEATNQLQQAKLRLSLSISGLAGLIK